MVPTKQARLASSLAVLLCVALLSFFFLRTWFPESEFVTESIESVEESKDTVMRFSAATLSASLAITLLPDDVATPLADSLADMNVYFIAILMLLHLEKLLILYGSKLAFAIAIPAACGIFAAAIILKRDMMKSLAVRLAVLGLAVVLVVPCSTHITNLVAADLNQYVEATIMETEDGAAKVNEVMESSEEERSVFERLSELFKSAINDISDLLLHFQNSIRKCMNSIAILLLTNCLMPILNFFILKWVLKETFHIAVPTPRLRRHPSDSDPGSDAGAPGNELVVAGE